MKGELSMFFGWIVKNTVHWKSKIEGKSFVF